MIPSPWKKPEGLFLRYLHENLVEFLEINLTVLWGPPVTGSPGGFNSGSSPHWASSNSSMTGQVFLPWYSSCSNFLLWVSALKSHDDLYALSLQTWGQQFALCPPLSYGSKKSCWFFSVFSFYLFLGKSDNFQTLYTLLTFIFEVFTLYGILSCILNFSNCIFFNSRISKIYCHRFKFSGEMIILTLFSWTY